MAKTNLKQMKSRETAKCQQVVAPLSANKSLIKQNMRGITFTLLIKTHLQKKFVRVSQILTARTKSALTIINLEWIHSYSRRQRNKISDKKIYKPQNIHSLVGNLNECKMAESKIPLAYQKHVVTTNTTCTASFWLLTKSLAITQT